MPADREALEKFRLDKEAHASDYPLLAAILVAYTDEVKSDIASVISNSQQIDRLADAMQDAIQEYNKKYELEMKSHKWSTLYFCLGLACDVPILEALYSCTKICKNNTDAFFNNGGLDITLKEKLQDYLFKDYEKEDERSYSVKN